MHDLHWGGRFRYLGARHANEWASSRAFRCIGLDVKNGMGWCRLQEVLIRQIAHMLPRDHLAVSQSASFAGR